MYGTLFVYAGPTGVGKTQDAASCFLDFSVVSLSAIHREAYGSPVGQLPRRLASRLGRGFNSRDSPLMGGCRGYPIHHGWLTAP